MIQTIFRVWRKVFFLFSHANQFFWNHHYEQHSKHSHILSESDVEFSLSLSFALCLFTCLVPWTQTKVFKCYSCSYLFRFYVQTHMQIKFEILFWVLWKMVFYIVFDKQKQMEHLFMNCMYSCGMVSKLRCLGWCKLYCHCVLELYNMNYEVFLSKVFLSFYVEFYLVLIFYTIFGKIRISIT